MFSLIIVESPTKARTIQKYFGKEYKVISSVGHIIDLPKSKLGIDIKNNFEPQYIQIKGKTKVIRNIKDEASLAENIIIATDPDREGEAIAFFIKSIVKNKNVKRALFFEITKDACNTAINNAGDINMERVEAQKARRILDRLVGYLISPYLWKLIRFGLSAGRVQTVALRLICEREDNIKIFKEDEFWTIKGLFGEENDSFSCDLILIDNKKPEINNEKDANSIKSSLLKSTFKVVDYSKNKKELKPPAPYITSTLQQEASRRLYFSAKKTMIVAQQLFEGIGLGKKGSTGLITYMRTDSIRISSKAKESTKLYIEEIFGKDYIQTKEIKQRTKKFAQEAHEAIRPTNIRHSPESIKNFLSPEQYKLYKLIFTRFLASQMAPAIYNETKVDLFDERHTFRGKASILEFDGFTKIYPVKLNNIQIIPFLNKGDKLIPLDIITEQHFTKPPSRYTEGTLVKDLESKGIGRPSTYASIISRLLDRKYVEIIEKKLHPTELGKIVEKTLIQLFPDIFDIKFTSGMEKDLDEIENGKIQYIDLMNNFYPKLKEKMDKIDQNKESIKKNIEKTTDMKCPKCGSPLILKWGRFGKFLACSNYPKCKYTKPIEKKAKTIKPVGEKCPECGADLIYANGKFGNFIACSNYPKCKYTRAIPIGVKCPEENCNGEIIQRRSKKGRIFYGCSNYPKCKFSTWYKPVNKICSKCGNYYMEEHKGKNEDVKLICSKCKHTIDE